MKQSLKTALFPCLTIVLGVVGLILRFWLFSATDSKGLLPAEHIADALSYLLLFVALTLSCFGARNVLSENVYENLFPASLIAAIGTAISAIGLGISPFFLKNAGMFRYLSIAFGVLAGLALLYTAYCRLKGLRPHFLSHSAVAVFLIFWIMTCCRKWGSETQLQLYFFPLLASLFLLLACYFRAHLDINPTGHRRYFLFSQGALFCCFLSLPDENLLFYLSAIIWLIADYCVLPPKEKRP